MNRLLRCLLLVELSAGAVLGQEVAKDNPDGAPAVEWEGPAQLLERGRAAFFGNDLAGAEAPLEKFVLDYGEAEEAREAARLHRPLVALCKVALGKFDEALKWIDESLLDPKIDETLSDELRFWWGLCLMNGGDLVAAQRAFGEYWKVESHNAYKRYEALLLFGTLYLQQDFPAEAADFLESQLPQVRAASPEVAGRALVLALHARMEAGQSDEALTLLQREGVSLDAMTQMVSFQTLVLTLGASFLEEGRYHEAISCLQRVWRKEPLLEFQAGKIAEIEERIAALEGRAGAQATVFQLRSILGRVRRERENFADTESFDSALRFRLAMAYQGLGRYREAALILEDMLATMSPDPVVEGAGLAEVQCWMEEKHWLRAAEAADRYEQLFGAEGKSLPTVCFLKAEALREAQDPGAAQLAYGELVKRFPKDPFAAKAAFMQGFLYLQQDDTDGALYQFELVRRQYPDSDLLDDGDHWSGMAFSFAGLYAEAREHLEGYLKRWKSPKYRKESTFRIAVCTFSLGEYSKAIDLLESFVAGYPGDPLSDEAHLLLGDAFFAEGRDQEGFAAYDRVRPESGRYFEDAWFKKGNALKLLEEFPAMRAHFEAFVAAHPESGRLPEAVYWIGWTHLQDGEVERARDIYWRTIEEHGDDPSRHTMTDLLAGLPKVYAAGGAKARQDLLTELKLLKSRAAVSDRKTLALRSGWAISLVAEGDRPRSELLDITKWLDPKRHDPAVAVAVAEAQLRSGHRLVAKGLFTEIRKWHPRALERDRIYRGLGEIAVGEGDGEAAIRYFERFGRETIDPLLLGEAHLRIAELHRAAGRISDERETLAGLLERAAVPAALKAEALLRLGHSHAGQGEHGKAIVFYERLYVAYGNYGELCARAYWGRGQSLETMNLEREALQTYEELISREELGSCDEAEKASLRVEVLRGKFPEESPEVVSGGAP